MCKSFFPIITVKLSQKCLSDYKLEVNWPETRKHRIQGCQNPTTDYDFHAVSFDLLTEACVAWRFWLGALRNKGGRGQRNREEIEAGATWKTGFGFGARSRASRPNFAATPLLALRPARQNRHATQAMLTATFLTMNMFYPITSLL